MYNLASGDDRQSLCLFACTLFARWLSLSPILVLRLLVNSIKKCHYQDLLNAMLGSL